MELIEPTEPFRPTPDPRPHMPEPPPVRIVAIDDVHLLTPAGLERELDTFYAQILRFERDTETADERVIAYHAEKHRVVFHVMETLPEREDYRPLQVETVRFTDVVQELTDRDMPFEWQRGIAPGMEQIVLRDPAGNWVTIAPIRIIL